MNEELESDYDKGIAERVESGELFGQLVEDGYTHGRQYTLGTLQFSDVVGSLYPSLRAIGTI